MLLHFLLHINNTPYFNNIINLLLFIDCLFPYCNNWTLFYYELVKFYYYEAGGGSFKHSINLAAQLGSIS